MGEREMDGWMDRQTDRQIDSQSDSKKAVSGFDVLPGEDLVDGTTAPVTQQNEQADGDDDAEQRSNDEVENVSERCPRLLVARTRRSSHTGVHVQYTWNNQYTFTNQYICS